MKLLLLAALLVACGKSSEPTPPPAKATSPEPAPKPAVDPDLARVKKIEDAMCACKDLACAKAVDKQSIELALAMNEKYKTGSAWPKDILAHGVATEECKNKLEKLDARAPGDAAIAKIEDASRRMCACTDRPCAMRVHEAFTAVAEDLAKNSPKDAQLDERQTKAVETATATYSACFKKLAL
jgi:hypothetical protein